MSGQGRIGGVVLAPIDQQMKSQQSKPMFAQKPSTEMLHAKQVCQSTHRVLKLCKAGKAMEDVLRDVVKDMRHTFHGNHSPING